MIFFGHIGITLLLVFLIFIFLKEKIDYRLVIIGAILPDLIDKPIGHYLFYYTFMNGRIFAHTILFVLLLTTVAVHVERKYHYLGTSVLALGAVMHLAEDQLWMSLTNTLWPLMGWQFPLQDIHDYSGYILYALMHEPDAYVPETIGLAILAGFIYRFELYRPERIKSLLATGRAEKPDAAIAR